MTERKNGAGYLQRELDARDAKLSRTATLDPGMPLPEGRYDPSLEKDSCGVGFIADIKGRKSHQLIEDGLLSLCNLEHRGAVGADPRMGDGAGILVQIPHKFFAKKAQDAGFTLPAPGEFGIGHLFLPQEATWRQIIRDIYEEVIAREGLTLLGWRDVPTDNSTLGESVKPTEPKHMQVFIGKGKKKLSENEFERKLYILRKAISNAVYKKRERRVASYYPVSISCRTVVYKGMFLADQLGTYYPDLHDPDFESAIALIHQRFSTNTFPTWSLAHPYRYIAHNGEINTLRGNVNWMAARQASVGSPLFGKDIEKLWPISYEGQSDTACFDNALEFLTQGGYSLAHAMMMMVPEARPGKMLLVDLDEGRLIPDEELKATLAKSHPYKEWLKATQIVLEELPGTDNHAPKSNLALLDRQQAFGFLLVVFLFLF